MTSQHSDTCSITCRNFVRVILLVQCYIVIRNWRSIVVVIQRFHVCLSTTAKNVIDCHAHTFNLQQQTFWAGHTTLITTTIEVTNRTSLQIPSRTDSHICLVVTTKEATNLEGITTWIREGGVDAHLVLKAIIGQQFTITFSRDTGILNAINHLTWIVQADDGSFRHSGIVTTTIGINNGTAMNIKESLAKIWGSKWCATGSHLYAILFSIIDCFGVFYS